MRFWMLALINLRRRPLRSILTILGVAVAVAGFVAMVGLSRGIERAWLNSLNARGTDLLAVRKGVIDLLTASISADLGEEIAKIPGVAAVSGALGEVTTLEEDQTSLAEGWPTDSFLWQGMTLVRGRLPLPGEGSAVVVGEGAAAALGKDLGAHLAIDGRPFKIVGIFRMGGAMGNHSVVMPLQPMQSLIEKEGKVTGFHIRVDRPGEAGRIEAVQSALQKAFPALSFVQSGKMSDSDKILKLFRAIAWSVSLIADVVALVVILNTLLMSVLERTREIGILSAVGWSSTRVLVLFLAEGCALTLLGGGFGLLAGSLGLHALTSLPRMRGLIEGHIGPGLLMDAFLMAIVLGLAGSLYPAWRATKLDPVEALGYE